MGTIDIVGVIERYNFILPNVFCDVVDRLQHNLTFGILTILVSVSTYITFMGAPIVCHASTPLPGALEFMTDLCFLNGTVSMELKEDSSSNQLNYFSALEERGKTSELYIPFK